MLKRNNSLDLLRVFACVAVVFIHVNFQYFQKIYNHPSLDLKFIIENAINIVTRYSVPCFVMISGGFNLSNKDNRDFKTFYKKTTWKVGVPAFVAAIFFLIIELSKAIYEKSSLYIVFIGFITGFYALWYLYVLAGLYFLTPFIISLKSTITKRCYCFMSLLILIWGGVSQAVSNYKLPYTIGTVGAFLGYYLMGDVIINYIYLKIRSATCFGFALLLFVITWIFRYHGFTFYTYVTYRNFFSPTILIASLLILYGFKTLCIKRDFSYLSRLTFHIYIIHTLVMNTIYEIIQHFSINISEIAAIFIVAFCTLFISSIIAVVFDEFWKRKKAWKTRWYSLPIWN